MFKVWQRAILAPSLLLLMVSTTGVATAQNRTGITDNTIKIGIPAPFTGPNSSFGAAGYGVAAYYRHVNNQGGVHGRKFEIILGDTGCNEAKGIALAKKLIEQDQVFLMNGVVCSGVGLAIRPIAVEAGIPVIVSTAANQNISHPVAKNIFHGIQTSLHFGQAMAKFALSKPGTKRIAIIGHTNEWAKGYIDPAVEFLAKQGIEPVARVALERGATDATAQVLSLRQANPDFVLVLLYEPELVVFLRAAQKFGFDVPKVGSLGADYMNTEKRLGSKAAMQNFFQVHQYQALLDSPEMATFRKAIESNLGDGITLTDFSFYGPGSAIAIVHVLNQIGRDLTREKFLEGMQNLRNFDTGVLAGPITFTPESHWGVEKVNVVGYDSSGTVRVFSAWDALATASK